MVLSTSIWPTYGLLLIWVVTGGVALEFLGFERCILLVYMVYEFRAPSVIRSPKFTRLYGWDS